MNQVEIAQHIIMDHNRLASVFASGGIVFQNSDSVILMGDTIKDLRCMAQQLQADIEAEKSGEMQDRREKMDKEDAE